jgi:hypothetical protein
MRCLVPGLAAVSIVALLAGCGGSDGPAAKPGTKVGGDQRAVLNTVASLQTASRKGDGAAICATVFTARLARSITTASKRGCAQEVRRRLFSSSAEISVQRNIRVRGAGATAVIKEHNGDVSTLRLLKQGGRWRIDHVNPGAVQ